MSAFLLNDFRDVFERRKRDISDVDTDVFLEWCNFAARFLYRRLKEVDPEQFVSTQNYTSITSGSQALPTDFKSIRPKNMGLFELDASNSLNGGKLTMTGPGSEEKGYYISGGSIVFTGIPSATSFQLRYIPKLTKFTDLSTEYFTMDGTSGGTIILDDEYEDELVSIFDVLYERWDRNTIDEITADQRMVRALSEILEDIRRDVDVYTVPHPNEGESLGPKLV